MWRVFYIMLCRAALLGTRALKLGNCNVVKLSKPHIRDNPLALMLLCLLCLFSV
jgi:hypothetical protein